MHSAQGKEAIRTSNAINKRKYPLGWDTASRPYRIWRAMWFRCTQQSHEAYPRYSDAGIEICDQWSTYRPFMEWARHSGYRDDLELDRRDNTRGYSPANCRWVQRTINARNRRDNLAPISGFGEQKTPIEWAEDPRNQVSRRLAYRRMVEFEWPVEKALTRAPQPGWFGDSEGHAVARSEAVAIIKEWRP